LQRNDLEENIDQSMWDALSTDREDARCGLEPFDGQKSNITAVVVRDRLSDKGKAKSGGHEALGRKIHRGIAGLVSTAACAMPA